MTTKLGEIDYGEYVVQIHYNPNLKTQPYLIRIYSWHDDPYELRVEKEQLSQLPSVIKKIIQEND